jgi:hypothetical protein
MELLGDALATRNGSRSSARRAYDHRIKEQIIRAGNQDLLPRGSSAKQGHRRMT